MFYLYREIESCSLGLKFFTLNLESFFSLALWKNNARKVFAVNEGDLIRQSKKGTSSNIALAALE